MITKKELAGAQLQAVDGFNRLAILFEKQGNLSKASYFYKRTLYMLRAYYGNHHPEVKKCMENLAGFYHRSGDTASARHIERQMSQYEITFGLAESSN